MEYYAILCGAKIEDWRDSSWFQWVLSVSICGDKLGNKWLKFYFYAEDSADFQQLICCCFEAHGQLKNIKGRLRPIDF